MRRTNNLSDNENTTNSSALSEVHSELGLPKYKFKNMVAFSTANEMSIDQLKMMFYALSHSHVRMYLAIAIRPLVFFVASYLAGNEREYYADTDDATSYMMFFKGIFWSFVLEVLAWFFCPIITYNNRMWVTIQLEKLCSQTSVSFMAESNKPGKRYARGVEWYELCALADKNYGAMEAVYPRLSLLKKLLEILWFVTLTPNISEAMFRISSTNTRSTMKILVIYIRSVLTPGLMSLLNSSIYDISVKNPFQRFGSWDVHKKLLRQKNIEPNHWTMNPKRYPRSFASFINSAVIYTIEVPIRNKRLERGEELQKNYFQTISNYISQYGILIGLLGYQQKEKDHNKNTQIFSILGFHHMAVIALSFRTSEFINRLERLLNTLYENKTHFDSRQKSSIVSQLKKLINLKSSSKVMQWLEIDDTDNIYYSVELKNKGNVMFDLSVFPEDSVRYTYMSQQDEVLRVEIDDITGFLAHCEQSISSPAKQDHEIESEYSDLCVSTHHTELPFPQTDSLRSVPNSETDIMMNVFSGDSLGQTFEEKNDEPVDLPHYEKVKTRPIKRARQLHSSPTQTLSDVTLIQWVITWKGREIILEYDPHSDIDTVDSFDALVGYVFFIKQLINSDRCYGVLLENVCRGHDKQVLTAVKKGYHIRGKSGIFDASDQNDKPSFRIKPGMCDYRLYAGHETAMRDQQGEEHRLYFFSKLISGHNKKGGFSNKWVPSLKSL